MSHRGFYTYALLDPRKKGVFEYSIPNIGVVKMDCEPFYVGKGKGGRDASHFVEARRRLKSDANFHKINRILSIEQDGEKVAVFRISDGLSEDTAFIDEVSIISAIGRRDLGTGPLTNWSGGGEGVRNVSAHTRAKHSQAQRKIRASHTEEQKSELSEKISKSILARWDGLSDSDRAAHAAKTVAHWETMNPAERETAMSACRTGYRDWIASLSEDERKAILGARSKAWWESMTPAQREDQNRKAAAALKASLDSRSSEDWDSAKQNMSKAQRARLAGMSEAERAAEGAKKAQDQRSFLAGLSEDARKEHFAKARDGQRKAALQCPHCPICHVNKPMMYRCHFDNCKHKAV